MILVSLLFVSNLLFAGDIILNAGQNSTTFTENTYQKLSVKSNISSIYFQDVNSPKGLFTLLSIDGYGRRNVAGEPAVPEFRKLIEYPFDATFQVNVIREHYVEIDLSQYGVQFPVFPAQPPLSKSDDPNQVEFIYHAGVYTRHKFVSDPLIQVTPVGVMRALNLARLDISPVAYNPVENKLRIYDQLEFEIVFQGGNISKTLDLKAAKASPYFESLYRQISNYKPLPPHKELITDAPITYVIVSDPMFQSVLQSFVAWKEKKGFKVIEAYTNNPNVGTTTNSIKAYLAGLYNFPPAGYNPPSFILFVGDVAQIPAWSGSAGSHVTDLRYCEYTNDDIPEVNYGRFSANNVGQLQPQIDKTLEYEKYEMPNPAFLGEAVMVAGADNAHQTHSNGQIYYGTENYFNTAHNILSHTYLQPEPSGGNYSQNIKNNVSNGVGYANYTAHCGPDGWSDPSFVIADIPSLQNAHKYCLMVGNCCSSSEYDGTCFAEEQLRAADKGSLGYIGGSNSTYWDEDYWWACGFKTVALHPPYDPLHIGAYDGAFHDHGEPIDDWYVTQGQMFICGNLAVEESSSGMKEYYWEIYCLMGDPSLSVYFAVPSNMIASYPNALVIGMTSLAVTTEPYAYVALSLNGELLDAKVSDANGAATLTFTSPTAPGNADMVITKQNKKPHFGVVQVVPANGPYIIFGTYTVNDSLGNNNGTADYAETITLDLAVNNVGVQTAINVIGTISTIDPEVTILDPTFSFGDISAGATVVGEDAFPMVIANNIADQRVLHFSLSLTDGTNTWVSTVNLPCNAPAFTFGTMIIDDAGGNNNGMLDPGETANIIIPTTNNGHSGVNNSRGYLLIDGGQSPYIMVNTPLYFMDYMDVGETVNAVFSVTTNGITPPGTVVDLTYKATAGSNSQYIFESPMDITIGQFAQYNMGNTTVTACSSWFFDSGGPNSGYQNNEDFTMTFQPAHTGAMVKAVFTFFDVEPQTNCSYDWLKIFNGPNSLSPLLGTWCGTNSPGTIVSTHASGALTFVFYSDYSQTYAGWKAEMSCQGGVLMVNATAFPPDVCEGSSSQLAAIASGGSGSYTYQWNPTTYLDNPTAWDPISTPALPITYTVTVNDGTTAVTSTPVSVTVKDIPSTPTITQVGDELVSDAATGNQWFNEYGMIPNATGQTYLPVVSSYYYVRVLGANGCYSNPSNSIYILFTGVKELEGATTVRIYPNPFRQVLNFSYSIPAASPVRVTLFNYFGQEVKVLMNEPSMPAGEHQFSADAGNLPNGIYFCRFQSNDAHIVTKLILSK